MQVLLKQQEELAARLDAVAGKLDAIAAKLDALISNIMAAPKGEAQPATSPSLALPMSPETLNRMILAADVPGHARMAVYQISAVVPAGTSVYFVVSVDQNITAVHMSPIKIISTYYSSALAADIYVDGKTVAVDVPMLEEISVGLGQYYYMTNSLKVLLVNNTTIDITAMVSADVLVINRIFFELFYTPLISYSYDILRNLAMTLNGGREIL